MGCGRLGGNVELRYTPGGHALARVLLAVDRYGKDGKKSTDWIRLVLWGKDAENASRMTGKGGVVVVMGTIRAEFWEKEAGEGAGAGAAVGEGGVVIGKLILLALALVVALWLGPKLVRFILADWQTRR